MVPFKTTLTLLLVFQSFLISSQTASPLKRTLQSKFLSSPREILVQLPDDYDYTHQKKYPVCYILDGEFQTIHHSSIVDFLTDMNVIPQMILVGIVNVNRNLDFTHLTDSTTNLQPNGGGKAFENFITQELIPYVDSNFATAPYNILSGHSLGGLFAATLFQHSSPYFDAYLIADPSLWWAQSIYFSHFDSLTLQANKKETKLFLSIANSFPSSLHSLDEAKQDTSSGTLGIRSILQFDEWLKTSSLEHFSWSSRYYPEESHGTVPFPGAYHGLKFIFDFYKRPYFQVLTDTSFQVLKDHYQMLSQKMKYPVLPSANDLRGLTWRCQQLEKNHAWAYQFITMYIEYYPQDPIPYILMGQHYEMTGDDAKAQEYYQKGIELGFDPQGNN